MVAWVRAARQQAREEKQPGWRSRGAQAGTGAQSDGLRWCRFGGGVGLCLPCCAAAAHVAAALVRDGGASAVGGGQIKCTVGACLAMWLHRRPSASAPCGVGGGVQNHQYVRRETCVAWAAPGAVVGVCALSLEWCTRCQCVGPYSHGEPGRFIAARCFGGGRDPAGVARLGRCMGVAVGRLLRLHA